MSAARFIFSVLLFAAASLVVLPAPALVLWQVKLGATEYGHWLVFAPLAVILAGRRRSVLDSASVALAVMAAVLFLSSSVRALLYASTAVGKMNAAFPTANGAAKSKPFSIGRLWFGGRPAAAEVQTWDYAEHEGSPLRLDFYRARGRDSAPCVVVIHGGGWDHGGRAEFPRMNHYLASRGYAVASVEYRLAPRWTWPAAHDDVLAAVSFLKSHAAELNIDPLRFVLFGRSAGGQIAESVASTGAHAEIAGCIAFYAPADMRFAFQYAKRGDILNSEKLLRQVMGGSPDQLAELYESASAYALANPRTPPTLLLHGANDELVWVQQSQRYSDQLRRMEVRHAFLRLPWATHAFDFNLNGPGGQLATWAVERFLGSVTAPR